MSEFWQIHAGKWIEGCMALSDEQELAYFRILNWTHLTDAPPPATPKVLAKVTKFRKEKAIRVVNELVKLGKLFVADGRLHNRRADLDLAKRNRRKNINGLAANNSNYSPETSENLQLFGENLQLFGGNLQLSPDKPLKSLEPESHIIREDNIREETHVSLGFDDFWASYPKRDGANPRKPALQKFEKAVRDGTAAVTIIEGAVRYHQHCVGKGLVGTSYVAMAVTWLNQERWNDEYSAGGTNSRQSEAERKLAEHEANWRNQQSKLQ